MSSRGGIIHKFEPKQLIRAQSLTRRTRSTSMTSSTRNRNVALENPTTELCFIKSSRPRMAGPTSKVLRSKDGHYMLPRSPTSPTLRRRMRVSPISGSAAARLKNDFIRTKGILLAARNKRRDVHHRTNTVSDLEKVEPFVVNRQDCHNAELIGTRNYFLMEYLAPLDQCIWPTAPLYLDLTKAPIFSPSESHTSEFFKLRSLDLLPAEGLSEDEFWQLFSRCEVCQNFMTTRTIPYHQCSSSGICESIFHRISIFVYFPRIESSKLI